MLERPLVRSLLESGEFPHLESVFKAGIYGQENFEKGLKMLLDGIEHDYGTRWPAPSATT